MYNKEIVSLLTRKYGEINLMLYCQMESDKNKLINIDFKLRNLDDGPNNFEYEAQWWENKYNELKNKL